MNPGLSIGVSVLTEGNRPHQNIISVPPASNIWRFHHLCPHIFIPFDLSPCLTVLVYYCCICAVFFNIKQHTLPYLNM